MTRHNIPVLYVQPKYIKGSQELWKSLKNLENHEKSSMHGKIMEFEKKRIIREKSWNFVK